MFSLFFSFILFFIVTVQPVNAQLSEESTPSAQIIPTEISIIENIIIATESAVITITPTPTDIASTLTEIILTPTEIPILTPILIPTATPTPEIILSNTEPARPEPVEVVEVPQITTDKADYSPTDIAIISGNNFLQNTQYILNITSDNLDVNYQIISDESGSFIYNYQLDGVYRPNYKIEVKDLTNNIIFITTFTDGRDVLSVTVNGSNSVDVFPGESIIVGVSVNTDWWWLGDNDWKSTSWRFGSSGEWNCVDTPNHLKSGDYFESFEINAPTVIKKYKLQVRVHGGKNCGNLKKSDIFTIKKAITVLIPDTIPPIITINPYDTNSTNQDIIVTASTNEGTLNFVSHAFESNDSFTFIATDSVGNTATETITINNIDKTKPIINSFINPSLPNADNNWYRTQPEISLINIENNPFIFQYKWDFETDWINYSIPLKSSFEGDHILYFQAQDLAGNQTNSFLDIKWDQTDPSVAPQNVIANPNNTSSSVSTIKWDQATDNIGIDKYEIIWTLNNPNNPLSYSKTVGSDIKETEIDKLVEGRWTVQVFAIDQSGLKKDSAIDLFIIKNKEIISSNIPIKIVFVQKKSSTIDDLPFEISPTPTSTPTPSVLGTVIIKKKFTYKWFLLFLPIIPLYISILKYNKKVN